MATKTEEKLTTSTKAAKEPVTYDLILVGASPSNLTLAHRLCDLAKSRPEVNISVAILEKSEDFGGHIVSGAVVTKSIFDKAFPNHIAEGMPIETVCKESHFSIMSENAKWDVPSVITRAALPEFVKEGYYVLTLSNVVVWMAETLKTKVKDIPNLTIDLYPGFGAHRALIENNKVIGVTVAKTGDPLEDNIYGSIVCFGDKGFISKDVIHHFKLDKNPQLWSVGVKETWRLAPGAPSMKGKVYHTLGYPTLDGTLGGGFVYGLDHNRLTIGLVISLDSPNPNIHPQKQLQEYKKHPWLQELLKGGELLNYGAAVLPEGGMASLPKEFQVDGALFLGDALGLLDMKSLAGVDKAIESGYLAADVVFNAFAKRDFSSESLAAYQEHLMESPFMDKLKANRYFRKAFLDNPDLLSNFLPKFLKGIELTNVPIIGGLLGPTIGALNVGFTNPIKAITQSFKAGIYMNAPDEVNAEIKYKEGYKNINPNFPKELIKRNQGSQDYVKTTIYSREDAVFYAHTKYIEHPDHIDEFSADTCLKCINKYESVKLDVPCVSDCTAEVHRLDIRADKVKVHAMSLENCVQCRTCEFVCPEQNLRVNAALAGAGPDFRGL